MTTAISQKQSKYIKEPMSLNSSDLYSSGVYKNSRTITQNYLVMNL